MMITAERLKKGSGIRVISPARSLVMISEDLQNIAKKRFKDLGYNLSFGKHSAESDSFLSSSIESRVSDIHDAFKDNSVNAIITTIGGFNSNELLPYLDFDLIKSNPKILIGYSDITALQNAIYAKTGLVVYSGPHFSSFGEKKGFEYSEEYFLKCLSSENEFSIFPSEQWSEDSWYKDQENRNFKKNKGFEIINEGKGEGYIVGGNMCTLNLLQGTEYMPDLNEKILFLEEDEMGASHIGLIIRNFESLSQQPGFKSIKGIVFGRFGSRCDVDFERLSAIVKNKPVLKNIPVIYGVDFGHTDPRITFPIGGLVEINTSDSEMIRIIKH